MLLQEYWLNKSEFHKINNIPCDNNVSILSHNVSEIDNHAFLSGRGYGGCSILWKHSLNCIVSPYCDILSEIMSVCNVMNSSNFIIGGDLNTYFKRVSSNFTKHLNYICEHESIKPLILKEIIFVINLLVLWTMVHISLIISC